MCGLPLDVYDQTEVLALFIQSLGILMWFLTTPMKIRFQMNKSERVHLEAIQYIESITCQIAESATSRDKNGNDTSKNCCREAFINESSSSLGQCENCSKCQVK